MSAHPLITIATRAARAAGDIIMQAYDREVPVKHADIKGRNDFVTHIDKRAEKAIIETIQKVYPDHAIYAEETGQQGQHEYEWIIDPLDGTTNFIRGIPHFAVSIACEIKGRAEIGVVYDPCREELFTASRGGSAQLNHRKIRISASTTLEQSLLATGFPFRNMEKLSNYLAIFEDLYQQCGDMRRAGAASLDLAYVACGRHDGFWEYGLKPWDFSAGALLVVEAGGIVSDFEGNPNYRQAESIMAANPKIFKLMLQHIQNHA